MDQLYKIAEFIGFHVIAEFIGFHVILHFLLPKLLWVLILVIVVPFAALRYWIKREESFQSSYYKMAASIYKLFKISAMSIVFVLALFFLWLTFFQ